MGRLFDGVSCIFCPAQSSPEGEHVLPRWLLKTFPRDEGYETWVGDVPLLTRDGERRRQTSLPGVKLPMCTLHNGILAQRFEGPMKSLGKLLFTGQVSRLTANEAELLGLWFMKTWLMLAHPDARYVDGVQRRDRWDAAAERKLLAWTVSGGPPPEDLSVWMSRRDDTVPPHPSPRVMRLPTVLDGDSVRVCRVQQCGIWDLEVTLLRHPGLQVCYPLEREGRALRLWPPDPRRPQVDLDALARVARRDTVWIEGPRVTLAPDRPDKAVLPLLAEEFDSALMKFASMRASGVQVVAG